ncbi:MAG: serine/threonine-protein kinase [Myxococcota bacterium]
MYPGAHACCSVFGVVMVSAIGRYRLLGELGSGGMATVHLAELTGAGGFRRQVAVKVLHPHLRRDPKVVAGFLREGRLSARLRHERVVSVVDVGESDEGVYLVMDYVPGVALARLLEVEDASKRRALGFRALFDALEGLHAAHELCDEDGTPSGLVHRDFSPQNILVDESGVARLADFGIARTATGRQLTTQAIVKGKLPYISPEQARGEPLDRRSDVWAAGVLAWEIATGTKPYDLDEEPVALLSRIAHETLPPVREVADLPFALADAIDWALKADAAERCPDAASFRRALEEAVPTLAERTALGAQARAMKEEPRTPSVQGSTADGSTAMAAPSASTANASSANASSANASSTNVPSANVPTANAPTARPVPWLLVALGGVALAVGVAAAFWPREPATVSVEPAAPPAPATEAHAEPPQAPPTPEPPTERPLAVQSNAVVDSIRIDGVAVEVEPGRRLSISVPVDAQRLWARARNGQTLERRIEGPEGRLRFGRARREEAAMEASELAGNPYGS